MINNNDNNITLSGDEPVSMAKVESLIRPEQLNACETHSFLLLILLLWWHRQWYYQRNIVARISPHDLTCSDWPIQPLYLPTRVLDHKHCTIHSLAIPHISYLSLERFKKKKKKETGRDNKRGMNELMKRGKGRKWSKQRSLSIQLLLEPHKYSKNRFLDSSWLFNQTLPNQLTSCYYY